MILTENLTFYKHKIIRNCAYFIKSALIIFLLLNVDTGMAIYADIMKCKISQ